MSSSTTWDSKAFGREADEKFSAFKRIVLFAVLVLALTVAANLWVYVGGHHDSTVEVGQPEGVKGGLLVRGGSFSAELKKWLLPFTVVSGLCGGGLLLFVLARSRHWQNTWKKRFVAADDEWKKSTVALQAQISESKLFEQQQKQIRTDLEDNLNQLTRSNGLLQEELDKRRVAEKALQQHRQELVRSKDVLEMHVQARTEQLQKLQRRYELILNSAGEGICGFDIQGKATFVNPAAAKITGWEIEELLGRTEQEVFGGDGAIDDPSLDDGHFEDQVFHRRDGSQFVGELVKTSIQENGREVGAVVIFKDITERKEVEQTLAQKAAELVRSNAELEQFAFVASHDLQEPLRKIQAFGDRLKIKCDAAANLGDARDYLERMQSAAARMQTLINDLLAFSRVIRSSQPFVPVDLAAVTKEVLGDLEVRIEKTGATVEVSDLPKIDADPTQMRQLMQNLISNALKFQPPDKKPLVKIMGQLLSEETAGSPIYQITVQDNGIGFDEKYLDKIFAVFQRLHGRSEYEGTGVGLAVCRRILDRHGGSITAKSKPGEGATFIMTLPGRQTATGNSQ